MKHAKKALGRKEWREARKRGLTVANIATLARFGMITPFQHGLVKELGGKPVVPYGAEHGAYTARLGTRISRPTGGLRSPASPQLVLEKPVGRELVIPGRSFIVGNVIESIRPPEGVVIAARPARAYTAAGLLVVPIEPWSAMRVLIVNNAPGAAIVFPGQGVLWISLDIR